LTHMVIARRWAQFSKMVDSLVELFTGQFSK